jgi:hypothetical protein
MSGCTDTVNQTNRLPHYRENMAFSNFRNHDSARYNDLPEYTSGVDIKSWKSRSPTQDIDISILNQKRHYDIGDIVQGSVCIKPHRDIEFSKIIIDICLSEDIAKPAGGTGSRDFSITRSVPPPSFYPPDLILRKGFSYTFSFALEIPDTLESQACKHRHALHTRLPPSIGSSPTDDTMYDIADLSARIYYSVRARIINVDGRSQKCMSHNRTDIRISPSHAPLTVYDRSSGFKNVVVLKSGRLIKSNRGTLELRVASAPLLFMKSSKPTRLELKLLYSTESRDTNSSSTPFQCAAISYKLISHTLSSLTPFDGIPEPTNTGNVHTFSEVLDTRKVDHPTLRWNQYRKNEYLTEISLPLLCPSHPRITPTFFSCLVSRQYRLHVEVMLEGCVASLEIPVAVC